MFSIFSKNISVLYLLLISTVTSGVTYFVTRDVVKKSNSTVDFKNPETSNSCSYTIKRLEGYGLAKPIIFVDSECESSELQGLKNDITGIISNFKTQGVVSSVSVYLKSFNNNDWICINENEKYFPGSLLKVPELITFLKMNEYTPGLLNKELFFDGKVNNEKTMNIVSKSIRSGQKYSIKELLTYMIRYSDNNATQLLNGNIDLKIFKKVFTDLGLQEPDWNARNYPISVKDYSLFMRVLFNANYLSKADSEFALELLSKSEFKDGILQGIPNSITVAHKFGEAGDLDQKELHESGIVFLNNSPYLLTIMTKGTDLKAQSKAIGEISLKIYQSLSYNPS
jgi:beta-lactamase class A